MLCLLCNVQGKEKDTTYSTQMYDTAETVCEVKMKSCPNGTCIPIKYSCSRHCGEGVIECDDYKCVDESAGETCEFCRLGQKRCGKAAH